MEPLTHQCGVCLHWVRAGEPHNCTMPHAGPPVLVLEPHESRKEQAA